ncbi:glycoside hydrolase family 16 protein [Natronococcus occultus]|uniref:Beta-glucanase/beta-glucan synthetase n=1 Tax=Natronococcus occultus SP4 TaxID=694430 RepID=L0K5A5_9EURY|nr:glycoside hydrolase family 16 protein [Natronococcus occultus]AGB39278.1 beta-glucanase/beta-glucan synthetase [Natronococcus occultus SP4]
MNRRVFFQSVCTVCSIACVGCGDQPRFQEKPAEGDSNDEFGSNEVDEGVSDTNWQLTFNDEFDQRELDTSVWNVGYGWGRTHPGLGSWEYVRDDDVWVDGRIDRLVLQADYDEADGPYEHEYLPYHWYAGGVNTKSTFSQRQGYFEARIRLPEIVEGILPAFWCMPDDGEFPPEIDIVEHFTEPYRTKAAIHWGERDLTDTVDYESELNSASGPYDHDDDPRENFVVYGAHWQEDRTDFYVDNDHFLTVTDGHSVDPNRRELNYGAPFYLMLSTQLSDEWGDPAQHDDYPYTWEIDWVRVWEEGDSA